jgi:hypothetical protein
MLEGLWDQALATLGATCVQNLAAVGCGHAGTKAVGAGAFELAGLEGPLHGFLLSNG